jgi:hypothetical protein
MSAPRDFETNVIDLAPARLRSDLAQGRASPAAPAFAVGDRVFTLAGEPANVLRLNLNVRPPLYLVQLPARQAWLAEQRLHPARPA